MRKPKKEKAKNITPKPKPLIPRKVVDKPGYARKKSKRCHRHQFLLTDKEEKVFQAIVDSFVKNYRWPEGAGRSKTFRNLIEYYNVENVKKEEEQRLYYAKTIHERGVMIEDRDLRIVSLEIELDQFSEELVLCQAELMILGKMKLNQETVECARQITEERKQPNAIELKQERQRLRTVSALSALEKEEEPVESRSLCRFCGSPWIPPEGVDAAGFCDACSDERERLRCVMYGLS